MLIIGYCESLITRSTVLDADDWLKILQLEVRQNRSPPLLSGLSVRRGVTVTWLPTRHSGTVSPIATKVQWAKLLLSR